MACKSNKNNGECVSANKPPEVEIVANERVSYCTYLCVSLNNTSAIERRSHSSQNSSNTSNSSHSSDNSNASNSSNSSNSSSASNNSHSTDFSNSSHSSNSSRSNSSHASRTATHGATSPIASMTACTTNLLGGQPLDRLTINAGSVSFHDQWRNCRSRPCSPPPATYFPARRPSLSLPPSPRSVRIHRSSLPFLTASLPQRAELNAASSSDLRTPGSPPSMGRRSPRRTARTPSPRPPLPPGIGAVDNNVHVQQAAPQHPQRSRPLSQPFKTKMRSR